MKIRMYNVGHGDCFCLRDRKRSLLVDFGSSNSRIDGRNRQEVFDVIISDLTTIGQKSLLLTQFHTDHLAGLVYMMKHRADSCEFEKIYLPDVFSKPEQSRTLALFLLADLMKDFYLPNRQVSVLTLVEALSRRPQKVELLSRGRMFEEKYQALWPDTDVIQKETDAIFQKFPRESQGILGRLTEYADKLRRAVYAMTEDGDTGEKLPPVSSLEREFRELRAMPEFQELLLYLEEEKPPLRAFKNKISVVFQNAREGELNLLFTGDVEQVYLQMIADDYDGNYPLYEHYWCVKVPHHGMEEYYFDFSPYMPENMLISNGVYFANSKKESKPHRISAQYAGLFYIKDAHMYCSNENCCDGYQNGCTCKECDIIAPNFYKDI